MSKYLSMRKGEVKDLDSSLANKLIEDGLASEYKLIEPTGKITITENGSDVDVAQYAKADVAVPNPNTEQKITGNITTVFSDVDVAELISELSADTATVVLRTSSCSPHVSENETVNLPGMTINVRPYVGFLQASITLPQEAVTSGFCCIWDSTGSVVEVIVTAIMGNAGQVENIDYGAAEIPATLTIIRHPLPEA